MDFLLKPYVTEKATASNLASAMAPVYVFKIDPKTNKPMLVNALKKKFGVKPVKVNIINVKGRKVAGQGRSRRPGFVPGFKKAIVTLKKGDKIEVV